jgi:hypothetical protein
MRHLYYSGGSVVVDDQVCKAVLRYARALAKAGEADLVVFPSFTHEHKLGLTHLLIGPSSQLMSTPAEEIGIDLGDARMVEILESRTKNLDPQRPDWGNDVVDVSDFTDFDWDF